MFHQYSHLVEKLLCLTYDALGVNLTGNLQVCDICARSKSKARVVRKKTYTKVSKPGERVFVERTGSFKKSLIRYRYWISVVDYYISYSWSFFRESKSRSSNKTEECFEKCLHVVLHLSNYAIVMRVSTNKNCRRCVEKKRLRWSTQHHTRISLMAS